MMGRHAARATALVAACALALAAVALAATPKTGKWAGKVTKGQVGTGNQGKPTFKVAGGGDLMRNFKIPQVGAFCTGGIFEDIIVAVPKAKIRHGKVDKRYVISNKPPDARPIVHLTGTFTSSKKFKGDVSGVHYCNYDVKFTAKPK